MFERWKNVVTFLVALSPTLVWGGPYSTALQNQTPSAVDPGVPGFVGPAGAGITATQSNGNVINPIFQSWATGVVNYSPTPGVSSAWKDPFKALGAVTGNNLDIVSLGDLTNPATPPAVGAKPPFSDDGRPYSGNLNDPNDGWGFIGIDSPGQITLSFANGISMSGGADFVVFENSSGSQTNAFIELAYVEVSTNGVDFSRFASTYLNTTPTGAFTTLDPTNIDNLAGKHVNAGGNSWGTPFSLGDLADDPLVLSGAVDLSQIWFVRLIDIPGNGTFKDSLGNPIYDPTPTNGSSGFDLEAIGVIHQVVPETSTLVLVGLCAFSFGLAKLVRRAVSLTSG